MSFKPTIERLEGRALLSASYYLDPSHHLYRSAGGSTTLVASNIDSFRVTRTGIVYALNESGTLMRSVSGGWSGSYNTVVVGVASFDVGSTGRVYAVHNGTLMWSDMGKSHTFTVGISNIQAVRAIGPDVVYAVKTSGILLESTARGAHGSYHVADIGIKTIVVDKNSYLYALDRWDNLMRYQPRRAVVQVGVKEIHLTATRALTYTTLSHVTDVLRGDVMFHLKKNPATFDDAYNLYSAYVKRALGSAFASIGEDGYRAVFATIAAFNAAPYGSSPSGTKTVSKLLNAKSMNCADYPILANLLYNQSKQTKADVRFFVFGVDGGSVGNHAQLYVVANGVPLILDPTTAVVARTTLDNLVAGKPTSYVKSFGGFDQANLQQFQANVLNSLLHGLYRQRDLFYFFDDEALSFVYSKRTTVLVGRSGTVFYAVQPDGGEFKNLASFSPKSWRELANVKATSFHKMSGNWDHVTFVDVLGRVAVVG